MEVIVAKEAGFCFGVERAIKIAKDTTSKTKKNIYTIGPIIHNNFVVDRLKEFNIYPTEDFRDLSNSTVVIRSHGVPPSTERLLAEHGNSIIDATCPLVKKAQTYCRQLTDDGYHLFIIGKKDHPEVQGLYAYSDETATIVNSIEDLQNLPNYEKIGIVAQTTIRQNHFIELTTGLIKKYKKVKIFNTICGETEKRQVAARELASEAGLMLVVGSKQSSNTKKLYEICKNIQPNTYHIEKVKDLSELDFNDIEKVGITGGASTPVWLINDIISGIRDAALSC